MIKLLTMTIASVMLTGRFASAQPSNAAKDTPMTVAQTETQEPSTAADADEDDPEGIQLFVGRVIAVPRSSPERVAARKMIEEACDDVNLTDAQKTQLRQALYDNRKKVIDETSNFRKARLDLEEAALSPTAPSTSQVSDIVDRVSKAAAAIATSRTQLRADILFNILTAEQRGPALTCMKVARREARRARREE